MPEMKTIARIYTGFPEKFGIPRQSGLVAGTVSRIVFEKEYRNPCAVRGISGFSHLWLIWEFSETVREEWSPTVRPPRLGGNTRVGVFATRSPFRPNPLGLSSVSLIGVDTECENAPVLLVGGADIMDGTPIYDIKPYLPFTDCHPDATGGFAEEHLCDVLGVCIPESIVNLLPRDTVDELMSVLSLDPRPSYRNDETRVYGLKYKGYNIKFTVSGKTLTVSEVKPVH